MVKKNIVGSVAFLFTDSAKTDKEKPFSNMTKNKAHVLFSKIAKKSGLNVFFADYKEYFNGALKKSWYYNRGWKLVHDQGIDVIYSRFAASIYSNNKRNKAAEKFKHYMAKHTPMINHPTIDEFCWDKLIIREFFPEYTPKTFIINTKKKLKTVLPRIKTQKYVLKPRYGTLGKDIHILDKDELPKKVKKDTLVQEFIDTSGGVKGITHRVHDLRVIVANGKIDHTFVRIPKKNMLIANVSLGARKEFFSSKKLSPEAVKIVKKVDKLLKSHKPRLYSVDFLFNKEQKPYIVECNSQPMIDKYAYGKFADPRFYIRICKLLKSSISSQTVHSYNDH